MAGAEQLERPRLVRRRAGHLYGLVVTGSVLAAAPETIGLVRLALVLVGTLLVYWAAESYAHWTATRTLLGRALHAEERREVVTDGLPLVAACLVPVAVLVAEAVLRVPTGAGVRVALLTNTALLVAVGWRMSTAGGVRGVARVANAAGIGLLGAALVVLKYTLLH
ncbi:hypothetical protein [Cellulomonas pakistanensis]|uniref:Integral membrane protein n=1 Tax=Cellulomonas pakistanensis TaxID=992287 RepID=A0A919U614_9CELL|nr:hypothetical protein [Cellulomonas pakistanensis]GIG35562.1 hypothetical protein Cpa01nite_09430 [Cellulomonas pakistanensis]